MAKPERLPGGFELANGRAADRVSEKEAEAGRSRRGSWTASAAASPWHDPGLRLQRLHKEAFLGAALSLLVRGRRRAGPNALRGRRRARAPRAGWPPPGSLGPAAPPDPRLQRPARSPRSRQNLAAAPPPGAGLLLLPLTGGPAASLRTWPAAGLRCLLRCPPAGLRPSLYGQKLGPSCPLVGGRPSSPPTETGPRFLPRRWASPGRPLPPRAGEDLPSAVGGPHSRPSALSPCSLRSFLLQNCWSSAVPILPGTPVLLGDTCLAPPRISPQLPLPGPALWGPLGA